MKPTTRRILTHLNCEFYRLQAQSFSHTRRAPWPGWQRVFAALPSPHPSVLDVGCGNGRLGHALLRAGFGPSEYVGIDASPELLHAAATTLSAITGSYIESLLPSQNEDSALPQLPRNSYDFVALFGVLHHIPDERQRASLLRACADRLAPKGLLAATFWQDDVRFSEKARPWRMAQERYPDLDVDDLDPGDVLLDWANGSGLRYCHLATRSEIERRIEELSHLEVIDRYDADSAGQRANHYVIWRRTPAPAPGE